MFRQPRLAHGAFSLSLEPALFDQQPVDDLKPFEKVRQTFANCLKRLYLKRHYLHRLAVRSEVNIRSLVTTLFKFSPDLPDIGRTGFT
jgi:hypothetical protein